MIGIFVCMLLSVFYAISNYKDCQWSEKEMLRHTAAMEDLLKEESNQSELLGEKL